mmetsp:Transcript_28896/g.39914  ORF Transcript_28896/g.39914 Transcript_28896/m.39914 type:complete len:148 (+) Transcript_28896:53-496(+)
MSLCQGFSRTSYWNSIGRASRAIFGELKKDEVGRSSSRNISFPETKNSNSAARVNCGPDDITTLPPLPSRASLCIGLGFAAGPTQLLAVPKKKISRSRKRIRNLHKNLPFTKHVIRCRICDKIKLPGYYCDKGCAVPGSGPSLEDTP